LYSFIPYFIETLLKTALFFSTHQQAILDVVKIISVSGGWTGGLLLWVIIKEKNKASLVKATA